MVSTKSKSKRNTIVPSLYMDLLVLHLFDGYLTRGRVRRPGGSSCPLVLEERLQVAGGAMDPVGPEAVIDDRRRFGDGHETRCSKHREVVLDGRLGEVELLGDLGQVEVPAGEQLED